jgi:hypothetical protein
MHHSTLCSESQIPKFNLFSDVGGRGFTFNLIENTILYSTILNTILCLNLAILRFFHVSTFTPMDLNYSRDYILGPHGCTLYH